jgi:hypothetical protein
MMVRQFAEASELDPLGVHRAQPLRETARSDAGVAALPFPPRMGGGHRVLPSMSVTAYWQRLSVDLEYCAHVRVIR